MDQFQLHFEPLILITRIKKTPDARVPLRFISLEIEDVSIKTEYALESTADNKLVGVGSFLLVNHWFDSILRVACYVWHKYEFEADDSRYGNEILDAASTK